MFQRVPILYPLLPIHFFLMHLRVAHFAISFFSYNCSYNCPLFCTFLHSQKTQTPCFQSFPHSGSKNTGGGGTPLSGARPFRGDCHAPNQSPVTNHQSPLWPSVPL